MIVEGVCGRTDGQDVHESIGINQGRNNTRGIVSGGLGQCGGGTYRIRPCNGRISQQDPQICTLEEIGCVGSHNRRVADSIAVKVAINGVHERTRNGKWQWHGSQLLIGRDFQSIKYCGYCVNSGVYHGNSQFQTVLSTCA